MKILFPLFATFLLFGSLLAFQTKAQEIADNPFQQMEIISTFQRPPQIRQTSRSSQIKDIQVFGESSGIAFTDDTLFRTDDNGKTWRKIALSKKFSETISAILFLDETIGWAILVDEQNARLEFAETFDGGNSWTRKAINLRQKDFLEADLNNITLEGNGNGNLNLIFRAPTSSNFTGKIIFKSSDSGQTWEFSERSAEILRDDNSSGETIAGNWILKSIGHCEGFKTGCVNESKIYFGTKEITPPNIKEFAQREREKAKLEAQNSVFANPPGGSTRLSLNRGFDKCTAATAAQMQTWWNTSPFYDANIYISGRNRGCSQPQLTAAWVNTVSAQGWGLIPTIVGYQSPCTASTTSVKHSSDPVIAETQGRGEADIAIADANNLGLTQGTVLYYDMERYDDLSGTGACSTPTKAFLKGWTDRVKELGYISGVYGSPTNAVNDWINIPAPSRMDVVWLARWDNVPSVWSYASPSPVVPANVWANHQRIKQWQAPHNETWGGVTFNIDGNIADGPVAGATIAKNKTADFDGDGKSDISVWRPDTGVWYIANSANASYTIQGFGVASDILAPGDYDGDGKTDLAVFRPETGVWHLYSRSIYRSFQFGTGGDIPVPADYNGDGYTDMAVFRPSNGTWYIWNTSGSPNPYRIEQFGVSGDKPVPGDYDGDGKTDLAVFRPSDGNWYLLRSSQGFTAINFGINTDNPAQGDYDGDGKTDLGIFRNGTWYLYQSQNGVSVTQFGLAGDLPATGDYDGDSKADIAVFRPSNGIWYLLQSLNGFSATQFGISGDKPIENAYLPQ